MSINGISNVTSIYSRNNAVPQKNQKLSFGMYYVELIKTIKRRSGDSGFMVMDFYADILGHVKDENILERFYGQSATKCYSYVNDLMSSGSKYTPNIKRALETIKSLREHIRRNKLKPESNGNVFARLADNIEENMYNSVKID